MEEYPRDGPVDLRTLGGSFSGFHAAPEPPRLTGSGEDDGKIVSRDGFGLAPAALSGRLQAVDPPRPRGKRSPAPSRSRGMPSVWVEPGAPVLSVLRRSGRRVRPPPGPAEVLNHHCARVGASASTAPRLPPEARAAMPWFTLQIRFHRA